MDVHLSLVFFPSCALSCSHACAVGQFFTRSPAHEWFSKRWSLRRADRLKCQNRTGTTRSQNHHGRRSTVNLWPPSDRQATAKRPSKNRQIFWNTLFYKVSQLSIFAALSGAGWSWYATKMLHLRAVSRKTTRSLKTVKITVVLGRLRAPVPLTLHLSWTAGDGAWNWNRPWPQTKTESKVASLKNRIYKDRLSQLPIFELGEFSCNFHECPFLVSMFRCFSFDHLAFIPLLCVKLSCLGLLLILLLLFCLEFAFFFFCCSSCQFDINACWWVS